MFLKRIELSGYKSFANRSVLNFEEPLTGIVGPNGCGKSNITDAVRFALGEQSAKSLRSGSSLNEMIFAGSQSRKPVNIARVTLVFDNSQKIFDSPYEEIEITRQIQRGSSEISNWINKTPCRLKDIQDLVMDTGLGRDSLSIISQGNISSFADARPEERRLLFEEAAGVAKYKKRKKISLAKLENVKANLERVQDQVDSCASQMKTLERQAEKAEQYLACKKELADIEISLLAMQIEENKEKELEQKAALERMQTRQNEQNRISMEADQQMEALQEEIRHTDARLVNLQNELARVMEESVSLNKQKAILDERRKISLSSADKQARAQSLLELFSEAKYEYEDRRRRLAAMKLDTQTRESHQQKALGESRRLVEESRRIENEIHSLQNQLAGVESRLAHPPYRNHGVQAVMHNASRLSGICGLVQDLLECDDEYMNAISVALGSANEQIVVESDSDARRAIGWLKRSGAGRATFLPLSVCKGRYLQDWQRSIAIKQHGILGEASRFVRCEPRYEALRDRLLGNILIASSLEEANQAARALRQSVKIVTLGGDVVHAGGAMTGGSLRPNVNPIPALKKEKERLLDEIAARREALGDLQREFDQAQAQTSQMGSELLQMKIEQEKLASIVQVKKEKYESLQRQIAQLNLDPVLDEETGADAATELVERISALHAKSDELNAQIRMDQEKKTALHEQSARASETLRNARRELTSLMEKTSKVQSELARIQTRLEQDLLRLGSDYSLTFEATKAKMQPIEPVSARAQVKKLRSQIVALGSVNLEAPEQLKEVRERYEFLTSQMEELISASEQILGAVDEMDQAMITQFKDMFDRINGCLDEVFQSMFGGGRCRLVLCEPDNLLESGVDVDVQPPGKSVKNLQTFSGGEKALIAISVLFAILKARTVPLCIFDEAEAALDQANVERFARYLKHFKDQSQFITVTHRPGTMEQCDTLFGITMQKDGVSQVLKVQLKDAAGAAGEPAQA